MPIEIEIRTVGDKDYLIIDGFLATEAESIKNKDIMDTLILFGYVKIKVTEE